MRYVWTAAALSAAILWIGSGSLAVPQSAPSGASDASLPHKALVDRYCAGCHNQRAKIGGLALDSLNLAAVGPDAEIWEKAIKKLRGRMMPPPGVPQPERAAIEAMIAYLEDSLDKAAAANPDPGRVALHRLNRPEYANAVEDLLGIRVNPAALLPVDDISDGFDNIAGVLKVSPSFLDQYLSAARAVTTQAVGSPPSAEPVRVTLRGGVNGDPNAKNGVPLGLRASLLVDHLFPADGEYEFRIAAAGGRGGRGGGGAALDAEPAGVVVTLDGVRVPLTGRVTVKGGVHRVGVSGPPRSFAESEQLLQSFVPGGAGQVYGGQGGRGGGAPGVLTVNGPINPTGPMIESASRQKIFVCHPASPAEELPCARKIMENMARRAFRRPVADRDLSAPMAFYEDGRGTGSFDAGIQAGLMAIFASPKFLYRAEVPPADVPVGTSFPISDLELASRLSFFLWSSVPDEELLRTAEQGRLRDRSVLEQQVKRMLADARSKALVDNFAFQWLKAREVDTIDPDTILFPNFDNNLRQSFRREMEMFLQYIIREDRSVLDLIEADYTFANERLAAHYGIPDVRGEQFRRVTLKDPNRWGLLGKGAILMVTSYPNRTAPVIRGAWILENILGTPPAAPPPDVEGFQENKEGEKARTVREIMTQHRANPSCNSCHRIMDPLGFALENFDAVGAWRVKDKWAGTMIDASGQLADGTEVASASDLREALMQRPQQFVQTMTEKMMTYALGRRAEYYDMPTVRRIVRDTAAENYRFSSLVMQIVESPNFLTRKAAEAE